MVTPLNKQMDEFKVGFFNKSLWKCFHQPQSMWIKLIGLTNFLRIWLLVKTHQASFVNYTRFEFKSIKLYKFFVLEKMASLQVVEE